jgi:hypothetical protein
MLTTQLRRFVAGKYRFNFTVMNGVAINSTSSFLVPWGGMRLSPLGVSANAGLLYQPRMKDDECVTVGGIRIGRGNRSTRKKLAPVPLCSPQIPHYMMRARTWAAVVGSRQLTA